MPDDGNEAGLLSMIAWSNGFRSLIELDWLFFSEFLQNHFRVVAVEFVVVLVTGVRSKERSVGLAVEESFG